MKFDNDKLLKLANTLLKYSKESKVLSREDIIHQVKDIPDLHLTGGAAMVLLGLRESTSDIDANVSEDVFKRLWERYGRPEISKAHSGVRMFRIPGTSIDVHEGLGSDSYDKSDNISVASKESLLKFYKALNREKDKPWISLLEKLTKNKLPSQEEIFDRVIKDIKLKNLLHASGGVPDINKISDVDILYLTDRPEEVLKQLPKGTKILSKSERGIEYSIPGYERPVNIFASSDPSTMRSVENRNVTIALREAYPDLFEKVVQLRRLGAKTEPAWAAVLKLTGDPYEVLRTVPKDISPVSEDEFKKLLESYSVKKAKEFAPGIRDPEEFGDISKLKPEDIVPFVIQRHEAIRSGEHYDVRLGKNKMFSWATRKLPKPGEKVLAIQQPVHCFYGVNKFYTNLGARYIYNIYSNKEITHVACPYKKDGEYFYGFFKILNKWRRRRDNEPLMYISYRGRPSSKADRIVCTHGHKLFSNGEEVYAGDCKAGMTLDRVVPVPSKDQQCVYDALLLAGISNYKFVKMMDIFREGIFSEFITWLKDVFCMFVYDYKREGDVATLRINTTSFNNSIRHRTLFSKNYRKTDRFFELANNPLILATLFQATGYVDYNEHSRCCYFSMQPQRRWFAADYAEAIKQNFGINIKYTIRVRRAITTAYMSVHGEDFEKFMRLIIPYISKCNIDFIAKVLRQYPEYKELIGTNLDSLDFTTRCKIVPVNIIDCGAFKGRKNNKFLYDLEVDVTHKYVHRGGILVGNSESYKTFTGTIPLGYGAGRVYRHDLGEVLVLEAKPNKIKFVIAHKDMPEEFTLVRMEKPKSKKPAWLLINTTPVIAPDWVKPHFKLIDAKDIDKYFNSDYTEAAKVDGALGLLDFLGDKLRIMSYRRYKETGWPIVHTYKFPGLTDIKKLPKELRDKLLLGEIYAERGGKAISAAELGGLLNATIANSRRKQQENNIKLKMMLFDVANAPGLSRAEKRELLNKVLDSLPKEVFSVVQEETTPEAKRNLYKRIISGEHPLTSEGVVFYPPEGGVPLKVKPRPEYDVYIREIVPGSGKYKGKGAGGFGYSLTPDGPIVGYVGTGFSDEEREDMLANPQRYIGRIARVSAQEQFRSGALRAPSYIARHEDYVLKSSNYILGKLARVINNE